MYTKQPGSTPGWRRPRPRTVALFCFGALGWGLYLKNSLSVMRQLARAELATELNPVPVDGVVTEVCEDVTYVELKNYQAANLCATHCTVVARPCNTAHHVAAGCAAALAPQVSADERRGRREHPDGGSPGPWRDVRAVEQRRPVGHVSHG